MNYRTSSLKPWTSSDFWSHRSYIRYAFPPPPKPPLLPCPGLLLPLQPEIKAESSASSAAASVFLGDDGAVHPSGALGWGAVAGGQPSAANAGRGLGLG